MAVATLTSSLLLSLHLLSILYHCLKVFFHPHIAVTTSRPLNHALIPAPSPLHRAIFYFSPSPFTTQRRSSHLEACLDDGDRQHADPSHGPGPGPQQHSLPSVRGPALLEVVLLQWVEGREVDPYAWDTAHKRLGRERMSVRGESVGRERGQDLDCSWILLEGRNNGEVDKDVGIQIWHPLIF